MTSFQISDKFLTHRDIHTNEQEIFMYDIASRTVNRLSGSLSSSFVDAAQENIFTGDASASEQIDRIDESVEDAEAEASNVVESVVALDSKPISPVDGENKIIISSGYSVIKNE